MGGVSEGTGEAPIVGGVTFLYVENPGLPSPPPEIEMTTQSNTGSLEYAYLGTFLNDFRISGSGVEGPDGWIRAGLYLSGEMDWLSSIYLGDRDNPYSYEREIINSGTIGGREFSIFSDSSIETLIRNSGELKGDVALGDGLDQIVNHGVITGNVSMGASGSFYSFSTGSVERDLIENHGVIRGSVTMGDGDDVFTSFGDARVGGKYKPASVMGMDGNDSLTGADWADRFLGNKGADTLIGGKGDDRLFGNRDDDRLQGGAGDDLLIGGLGKDRMLGGDGADVFRFRTVETSGRGARADRIEDFETGTDLIDLSRIADDIAFVGTNDFAGTGLAELRYSVGDNGTARVLLDADGDGEADMRINLLDTAHLQDGDFLL